MDTRRRQILVKKILDEAEADASGCSDKEIEVMVRLIEEINTWKSALA